MNRDNPDSSIDRARKQFGKDLMSGSYAMITSDKDQLSGIMAVCKPVNGSSYLDIGTGQGYMAFAFAEECPEAKITGIDIVGSIIEKNRLKARELGLKHAISRVFDGKTLPFEDESIDGIIARYSFHHFPEPGRTMSEIGRVLKQNGFCFIAGPVPYDNDGYDFANRYSLLRDDGHIKYYMENELAVLFEAKQMYRESAFYTEVKIPRAINEEYRKLLDNAPEGIKKEYKARTDDESVEITVKVINVLFRKSA